MNRRVFSSGHKRVETEWEFSGNGSEEAHLGEVPLNSVGGNAYRR